MALIENVVHSRKPPVSRADACKRFSRHSLMHPDHPKNLETRALLARFKTCPEKNIKPPIDSDGADNFWIEP